ncbi:MULTISPECIES: M23 family metallopeptidase [Bacillus]|uniref:M23 family metallopeptidase n=1 Tax=Bacillus glycinifermentans TaxID=1664069 RepID=A0AAJ3Z1M9_9BACI|nr:MULTISPECIES: M23 family metallopeptidase [Bacillus]KKB74298.1 peptidase M23 [Bacillus sp. TH008]MBU8787682.1 M23 family metallopeptidase [Bacillus glycinifermentans]MDU0071907.1 M23 family metallopeptidase [Bacillus sp. IG6]MED8019532.1 M23 family metallopeptidase [Bacillus glycinifermentans]NUJ17924.1 M23 family metallopeptidase [Bacillus glycinifermentans]
MKEEEKNRTSKITKLQRFFRRRWVFPAIYLISAVVVLTAVLWYQSASNNDVKDKLADDGKSAYDNRDDAVEVGKPVENVAMPVIDSENVTVVKKFFETNASKEEKEAALVNYDNTYSMSKGIDLAEKDGKTFDVSASLSGTVIKAAKDPVLGYVVEIEHEDGLSTVYQSLSEVSVKQGDKIEQNQVIGKAGKNLYNEEGGNHVHFEIRKDGVALNPLNFMDKPVSSIEKAMEKQASEVKEPAQPSVEEKAKTEEKAKDDTEGKTKREDSTDDSGAQDEDQTKDSTQP